MVTGKKLSVVGAVVSILLLVLCISSVVAASIHDGDPNTIGSALAQQDGATVTLAGEQVLWRGKSGKSFAIKEWFEKQPKRPRILVVSSHYLPVGGGWSVDLTGVLATFSSATQDGNTITQRVLVVSPESVRVFCDPQNKPVQYIPTKEWDSKVPLDQLTASPATARATTMDESLPSVPDDPSPSVSAPAPGSRDSVKWLADGAPVSLGGMIVTLATQYNDNRPCFYVERSDRTFGIRVHSTTNEYVEAGWSVNIVGQMTTVKGEREIEASTITRADSNVYPLPLPIGMPNRSLGGGGIGSFTPAVPFDSADPTKNGVGPNTTGLLVRAWGKVSNPHWGSNYGVFYIDDGSNVTAGTDPDSQSACTGIKVYDTTWGDLPTAGDQSSVTGISGAIYQSASSTGSIRALWKVNDITPSTQPGTTATVTGTITATGADGKTVRVFSGNSSTTATFTGNTASYTLHVPAGTSAVTASVIGYQTATQLVNPTNGQAVSLSFTLSSIAKIVEITPASSRIAPDGVSETTVTAVVRDMEGKRIPNASVVWTIDRGALVNAETITNAVGEATATIRSSTNHETATIWVQAGGSGGGCYVEFANPDDPSIIITDPTGGDLSGFVPVRVVTSDVDSAGGESGLMCMQLYVDGQPKGSITTNGYRLSGLDTSELSNGLHVLTAVATDADLNTMRSQAVEITVDNNISQVDYSSEIFTDDLTPGNIAFNARMITSGTWSAEIKDYRNGTLVYSSSGTGPGPVQASWDGKVNGNFAPGIYAITLSSQPTGQSVPTERQYLATISRASTSTLICGKFQGEDDWSREASIQEMYAVADGCEAQGVTYTLLADPLWVFDDDPHYPYGTDPNQGSRLRLGFKAWINKGYHNFFYSTHGKSEYTKGKWRSSILFDSTGGQVFVYGTDYDWTPTQRQIISAFSDLDIWSDQFRIVQINACWSAGNYLRGVDATIPNAFGNYGAVEDDQAYLGWMFYYYPSGSPIVEALSPNGTQWTKEFWRQLGLGYTVAQAEWNTTFYNQHYRGWMHNFLSVYGGPDVTYLTSW